MPIRIYSTKMFRRPRHQFDSFLIDPLLEALQGISGGTRSNVPIEAVLYFLILCSDYLSFYPFFFYVYSEQLVRVRVC